MEDTRVLKQCEWEESSGALQEVVTGEASPWAMEPLGLEALSFLFFIWGEGQQL